VNINKIPDFFVDFDHCDVFALNKDKKKISLYQQLIVTKTKLSPGTTQTIIPYKSGDCLLVYPFITVPGTGGTLAFISLETCGAPKETNFVLATIIQLLNTVSTPFMICGFSCTAKDLTDALLHNQVSVVNFGGVNHAKATEPAGANPRKRVTICHTNDGNNITAVTNFIVAHYASSPTKEQTIYDINTA